MIILDPINKNYYIILKCIYIYVLHIDNESKLIEWIIFLYYIYSAWCKSTSNFQKAPITKNTTTKRQKNIRTIAEKLFWYSKNRETSKGQKAEKLAWGRALAKRIQCRFQLHGYKHENKMKINRKHTHTHTCPQEISKEKRSATSNFHSRTCRLWSINEAQLKFEPRSEYVWRFRFRTYAIVLCHFVWTCVYVWWWENAVFGWEKFGKIR